MSVTLRSGPADLRLGAARPAPVLPVEASALGFAYGDRRVLDGVDFAVQAGEIVAVIGPNGSGKSTLLRLLAGLLVPQGGSVRWRDWPAAQASAHLRAAVGVIGHRTFLFEDLTALENLVYYAELLGLADPRGRAREALGQEGLGRVADRPAATLSRGLAQRVSICRTWLADPLVVLADEAETGLDPDAGSRLRLRLQALRAKGGAAVVVGHDLAAALELADRYVVLAGGRVVDAGAASPWRSRPEGFAERYRLAVAAGRRRARAGAATVSVPQPASRAAGGGFARAVRAVLRREFRLWLHGRERLGALLAFGLLVALVFGFALDPTSANLRPVFGGLLWTGLLFAALPPLQRSFAAEWENDALLGFRAAGGDPAALFYGKALAHSGAFVVSLLVLVPAFGAMLEVRLAAASAGVAASLALGALGFVPAASLVAAVVARALGPRGGGMLPLLCVPLLVPGLLGTVRGVQAFIDGTPGAAAPWLWLLGADALLFWALPYALFPFVAEA